MLTNEDIAEVLSKFQKLENLKKAQAKASSGGNAARRGVSIRNIIYFFQFFSHILTFLRSVIKHIQSKAVC